MYARNNNPLRVIPDFVWALIAVVVLSAALAALGLSLQPSQPPSATTGAAAGHRH